MAERLTYLPLAGAAAAAVLALAALERANAGRCAGPCEASRRDRLDDRRRAW